MKFKIKLIDVGRENHCQTLEKEFKDLKDAELFACAECSKHIMSSEFELIQNGISSPDYVFVVGGFRPVGAVIIVELKGGLQNDKN